MGNHLVFSYKRKRNQKSSTSSEWITIMEIFEQFLAKHTLKDIKIIESCRDAIIAKSENETVTIIASIDIIVSKFMYIQCEFFGDPQKTRKLGNDLTKILEAHEFKKINL